VQHHQRQKIKTHFKQFMLLVMCYIKPTVCLPVTNAIIVSCTLAVDYVLGTVGHGTDVVPWRHGGRLSWPNFSPLSPSPRSRPSAVAHIRAPADAAVHVVAYLDPNVSSAPATSTTTTYLYIVSKQHMVTL